MAEISIIITLCHPDPRGMRDRYKIAVKWLRLMRLLLINLGPRHSLAKICSCHHSFCIFEEIVNTSLMVKSHSGFAPCLLTLPEAPSNLPAVHHLSRLYHLIICCPWFSSPILTTTSEKALEPGTQVIQLILSLKLK